MLYGLEQGQVEMQIIEMCVRSRQRLPDKIANAPDLFEGNGFFYMAFMDMTSCRELGYGSLGPIDWLTIQRYCEVYNIEGEQREDVFYHVNRMDRKYLEWVEGKRPKVPKE